MTLPLSNLYVQGAGIATGITAMLFVLRADLRRRALSAPFRISALSWLDLVPPPLTIGGVAAALLVLIWSSGGFLPLRSPAVLSMLCGILIAAILWREGQRQIQFQRPEGIVFAEWLTLGGVSALLISIFFRGSPRVPNGLKMDFLSGSAAAAGCLLIARIVPPFAKKYEGLRILDRVAGEEQFLQPEYTDPTPECPNPSLWKMLDSQTTEVEVLNFLQSLVTTLKPLLVVETGTFLGHGTLKLAQGVKENGFGRVITIEYDPTIYARAKERIEASGLREWIEARNESSLHSHIDGIIDFLYSDSHLATREEEIRRFLPQLNPRGVLVVHDASSHFQIVRQAVLRLEQEGALSVVLLSTPRGVVIAQKREGRT